MKKYVRLDCDNVSDQIECFLYNSETSKAQDLSNNIKGSINKTVAWIKQKFTDSEILLIGADDILFTSANITETDLDQIKNIFFQLSNLTISIGVGETIKESMQNLLIAKVSGKNKIIGI
jgi:GTP cyclohydrolase III